jgi:hypothetical protein
MSKARSTKELAWGGDPRPNHVEREPRIQFGRPEFGPSQAYWLMAGSRDTTRTAVAGRFRNPARPSRSLALESVDLPRPGAHHVTANLLEGAPSSCGP